MASQQILGSDKTIRINNYNVLGLVQNFNWAPNFNAQDVFELGRTTRLETLMELETSGSFEVASSGNLAGILARMKVKTNGSTGAFEGFDYAPTPSGTMINAYTFTQDDLANLKFDVVQHEKTEQTVFNRSTYLACCYPTTINGRVDTTGMAMETINWAGLFPVGFPQPFHDIRAVPCTKASNSTVTTPATYNATDWEVAYLTVDGRPLRKVNSDPAYISGFTANTITIAGASVADGVVVMAALFRKTPTTNWATVHQPDTVGAGASAVYGVRGYQANVYLAPLVAGTPVPSEQWLKVQSLDWSLDFRVEALRQVAFNQQGTTIYHRVPTFPFTTSVNATVNETDWADWKAVQTGKTFTGTSTTDVYNNAYELAPQALKREFAVVIDYFTKTGTKIQTVTFGDLRVDGMGNRINVGGRGEVSWSFRGTQFKVQGFDL